jgi:hypothetical protein
MLRRTLVAIAAIGAVAATIPFAAGAASASRNTLTVAVYGDSPYGKSAYVPGAQKGDTAQQGLTPGFVSAINNDAAVSQVFHVGDIHSGKEFCTTAYDQLVASLWTGFTKPLVYTPGDNEWTDCHKATSATAPGEGGGFYSAGVLNYIGTNGLTTDPTQSVDYAAGNPVDNLNLVRSIFFANPGKTLGSGTLKVTSQAKAYNRNYPTDKQFVENVLWEQKDTIFVSVNIPGGSNNDADVWYKGASETQQQTDERTQRTAADLRWIDAAFALANAEHASGVVILEQADMWDLDGKTTAHLTNYAPFISEIAAKTTEFGKPVLLFNGDSHLYRSDNPLVAGAPCTGEIDPATALSVCAHDPNNDAWVEHADLNLNVPNFHRVVVHGSTTPLEYLRLTINPEAKNPTTDTSFGPFSWVRVNP